jgi:hypothetical protein
MCVRYHFIVPDVVDHALKGRMGHHVQMVERCGRLYACCVFKFRITFHERLLGMPRLVVEASLEYANGQVFKLTSNLLV